MRSVLLLAAVVALSCFWMVPAADAAVRACRAPVASGLARAGTEFQARRLALDGWKAKAQASAGTAFNSWRLANNKTLRCAREADGQFACVALGTPCTIQQNPNKPRLPGPMRPRPGGAISI